jgi:glycosyltransferase involved in cell wall biosynthesis/predicted O-methyltransferase YrrM
LKIAVITAYYGETPEQIEKCIASVKNQSIPATHILVLDGVECPNVFEGDSLQIIRLGKNHNDVGDTPRAIGSISAITQGFEAIVWLDGDNWFEPHHLESLVQLQLSTGASVCTSRRILAQLNGQILGLCPDVDGEHFVDTNCFMLFRPAFSLIAVLFLKDKCDALYGDRTIWENVLAWKLPHAHSYLPTVIYRTRYRCHYHLYQVTPPENACDSPYSWEHLQSHGVPVFSPCIHQGFKQVFPPASRSSTSEVSVYPSQSLAVCMMVQNSESTLEIALSSVEGIWDELIVVDGGSTDDTVGIAKKYGAKVIYHPWPKNYSEQRNIYLKEIKSKWFFVLDSDEFIDIETREFLLFLKCCKDQILYDNFWLQRKWISPSNPYLFLTTAPHAPDPQRRIMRFNDSISYENPVHEAVVGLENDGAFQPNLCVYHLDLFVNDKEQRLKKVEKYTAINELAGMPEFYLPEQQHFQTQPLELSKLLPSTVELIHKLPKRCRVCSSVSHFFDYGLVLGKYEVRYYRCSRCRLVQTEQPYWLAEAYQEAIADSDIGILARNSHFMVNTACLINAYFQPSSSFLDFGGGYGLFVRMMRDQGFDFRWADRYCNNIFAQGWEGNKADRYELITAFEVLEHLLDPIEEMQKLLEMGDSILCSTTLMPLETLHPSDWWYYALHEGQHITLYTHSSLLIMAERLGVHCYSNGIDLHLFTKKMLPEDCLTNPTTFHQFVGRKSLIESDFKSAIARQECKRDIELIERGLAGDTNALALLMDKYKGDSNHIQEALRNVLSNSGSEKHIIIVCDYLASLMEFQMIWEILTELKDVPLVANSKYVQSTITSMITMFESDPVVASYLENQPEHMIMESSGEMKGMHVMMYTDDPGIGGVGQYNHSVLCALIAKNYQVSCVQSKLDSPLVEQREKLGIVHKWLSYDTQHDYIQTRDNPEEPMAFFRKNRPDLIIFSDGCPLSNLAAKDVAVALGIPFVMVQGYVAVEHCFFPPQLASKLRQYNRAAHDVVAVSHENLALLHRHFYLPHDQGKVIHYGRPKVYFQPPDTTNRKKLRAEWNIPEDAIVCFTSARLEEVKGHKFQLAAIKLLQNLPQWENLYFIWVGAGSLFEDLQQHILENGLSEHVKLLGQRWDVSACLDAADIFILPSLNEGMPLAIMEAMARGVPVIASAVSGIPEELGDTGFLIADPKIAPDKTINELAHILLTWSSDPECLQQVGEAERLRALSMFTEERMLKETLDVIERALLPVDDYISPNLSIVLPDRAFPNMLPGNHNLCQWPFLRRELPHNWYVDARYPTVGFLSRDEAHILHNLALQFKGKRALEIGCWLGWSACHLALAGVELDIVDPVLTQPFFLQSVCKSLEDANISQHVHLLPASSPEGVRNLAEQSSKGWSLVFIDGDHEAPAPLIDAIVCEGFAEEDALVVFHDLASPDVAEGLHYFRQMGWHTLVYQTTQIMGIAWRGAVHPIDHRPDPRIKWELPQHLQGYQISGIDEPSGEGHSIPSILLRALLRAESEESTAAILYFSQQNPKLLTAVLSAEIAEGKLESLNQIAQLFCSCFEFSLLKTLLESIAQMAPSIWENHEFSEIYQCIQDTVQSLDQEYPECNDSIALKALQID